MAEQVVQVGLRELRLDTRRVVERAARSGPIEITDRGAVIAVLTAADGSERSRRTPRTARALQLLDHHTPVDTGALDDLMADKQADIELGDR